MITLKRFRKLEKILREAGFGPSIDWTESVAPPVNAEAFASEAIYVICNSGFRNSVAVPIHKACMKALRGGRSASEAFGHEGKCGAIDQIWRGRDRLFAEYQAAENRLEYLVQLPWIGPVTAYHLEKNLGGNHAKPDVHLERLARGDRTTTAKLCGRLARQTGYRAATIDTVLWRACAEGLLDSKTYERQGWAAAFAPKRYRE